MRYVTFIQNGKQKYGALRDEQVIELDGDRFPPTLMDLILAGEAAWADAAVYCRDAQSAGIALSNVRLLAPLTRPGKIVCVGLNYMDHCREQNVKVPERPLLFAKFTTAITGPYDPVKWDPTLTGQVDFEVELGVVIGRTARSVTEETALDYVFGYTVANDVSARDLQFSDVQWVRGKSLDTFCPIGPAIVTADEIPDPQALALRTTVNGVILQDSNTAEMIFDVRELIAFISRSFTLEPGDLILTGTPHGVGVFRNPQVFLKDGDQVVVEVENIGRLENKMITA